MIVVDASVLLESLLRSTHARAADQVLFAQGHILNAPHLIDVEVAHVVRRLSAAGLIDAGRGKEALANLAQLRLHRHGHQHLLPRIWVLRHNFSAYDAAYMALAESIGTSLYTCDRNRARTPGAAAKIVAVG